MAQQPSRQRGFSRLELMTVVLVVGILAAILLDRLYFYQEMAEKSRMEYTISRIKSGLRLRMAGMLVAGRAQEYFLLARQNPMEWLEDKPDNYIGELENMREQQAIPGTWHFDRANNMLVYQVQHGEHFQQQVGAGQKQVRLKVVAVRNGNEAVRESASHVPSESVAIALIEPYQWF